MGSEPKPAEPSDANWQIFPVEKENGTTKFLVAPAAWEVTRSNCAATCDTWDDAERVRAGLRLIDRVLELAKKLELRADECDDPQSKGYDPQAVEEDRRIARDLRLAVGVLPGPRA